MTQTGPPARAHLAADRAAGAGDEHDFLLDELADGVEVELDRFAAEQVFDGDRSDAGEVDLQI